MNGYVLWVIPDRGGGWSARARAETLEQAELARRHLYDELGDVSVRVLLEGEHPANGTLDVIDPRRAALDRQER